MPMPQVHAADRDKAPIAETEMVIYDAAKQQSTTIPIGAVTIPADQPSASELAVMPEDKPAKALEISLADNFTSLTASTDITSYPKCTMVKLFMTFPNGKQYVCSGTLVDRRHVLTAGHCAYGHDDGGWATEMVAVPAYSGESNAATNRSTPFGAARMVRILSNTLWVNSKNYDGDYALVSLDRPVGALTGYLGYGYNTDNNFFKTTTFYNNSYPGASPYNGLKMYERSGKFDATTTYIASFNNKSYGGSSGSGSYFVQSSGNRSVQTILSYGVVGKNVTGTVRLDPTRFGWFQDFIAENTPATVDLAAIKCRVSGQKVSSSQPVSLSVAVYNNSKIKFSGAVKARVYLSTNDVISNTDYLIAELDFGTQTIESKQSKSLTYNGLVNLPANYTSTLGYVGVILQNQDASAANNATNGWDAEYASVSLGIANDGPAGAFTLLASSSANYTAGTNIKALLTTTPQMGNCSSNGDLYVPNGMEKDVWFVSLIPASGVMTIRMLPGTMQDGVMYLYGSNDGTPNNLYYVACEDDNVPGQVQMPVRSVSGTPGQRVYIRVFGYAGETGTFQICALNYITQNIEHGGGDELAELNPANSNRSALPHSMARPVVSPNPANTTASIRIDLVQAEKLTIQLFDIQGKIVKTVASKTYEPGAIEETFDVLDLPNALYFLRASSDSGAFHFIEKCIVQHAE